MPGPYGACTNRRALQPQAFGYVDAIRAVHLAGGAIAAPHGAGLFRQLLEVLAAQRKLPVEISVGEVAEGFGNRRALGALAAALVAHTAVERADLAVHLGQQFLVIPAKRLGHGPEIRIELVDVGHAGNGGGHALVFQDPLQRRQAHIRLLGAGGGRHHLHRHQADAGGGQLVVGVVVLRARGEAVGAQQDFEFSHRQDPVQNGIGIVRADADVPDLPLRLGVIPDRDQLVGNGRNAIPRVHVPDVQVVRTQFLEAGIELGDGLRGRLGFGFAGEHDFVAVALQCGPDHALVIALPVPARGVEIGDTHVGRPGNHASVGRNHAPVTDRGDLKPGLAQRPVADRRGARRCRSGSLCGGCLRRRCAGHAGDW